MTASPMITRQGIDTDHGREPQTVQDFTESFTALLVQQGLPRMAARVMACLYTTDAGAPTASDLAQRLNISAASVSHAVAFLEQQGLLTRERTADGRRDRYAVDDEIWLRSIVAALQMNNALAAACQRGAEIPGPTTPAGLRFESSAELLGLVTNALRHAMDQWRQTQAARHQVHQPHPPTTTPQPTARGPI